MPESSRWMLDTNIASLLIRSQAPALRERLQKVEPSRIYVSAITEAELLSGVSRRPEAVNLKVAVDVFLRHVQVLPWGSQAAAAYGDLRARLEARGQPLGNLDTLIAAHAIASECQLVTNDRALLGTVEVQATDWTNAEANELK